MVLNQDNKILLKKMIYFSKLQPVEIFNLHFQHRNSKHKRVDDIFGWLVRIRQ